MRVLLVDDDPLGRRMIRGILERQGHSVASANNGRDAVDALEKTRFDVVLMDIQMPIMDGFRATMEIRKREHIKKIWTPIVALTSLGYSETYAQNQMDGYLGKPVNTDLLLFTIDYAVAKAEEKSRAMANDLSKSCST